MAKKKKRAEEMKNQGWFFLLLTLPLTWLFWIPAGFITNAQPSWLSTALLYIGGIIPALVAIWIVQTRYPEKERSSYWRRTTAFKKINNRMMAITLIIAPMILAVAGMIDRAQGGSGLSYASETPFGSGFLAFLGYGAFLLAFGPIPEELGWRGLAQEQFDRKMPPIVAALIIGVYWTLWHLPLFFIAGSYQNDLGIGTPEFWLFMLDKIPQSIIMAWIMVKTRHITLSAILFHFMVNLSGELFIANQNIEILSTIIWWILAFIIVITQRNDLLQVPEKTRKKKNG